MGIILLSIGEFMPSSSLSLSPGIGDQGSEDIRIVVVVVVVGTDN